MKCYVMADVKKLVQTLSVQRITLKNVFNNTNARFEKNCKKCIDIFFVYRANSYLKRIRMVLQGDHATNFMFNLH